MLASRNEGILGGEGYAKPLSTSLHTLGDALEIRAGIQVKNLTLPSQAQLQG